MKEAIFTQGAPAAIGPYSQAIKAGGLLFISGQLPIDPATGEFAGSDIESQARQALNNLKAIINAAGTDMQNVVKVNVYMKDMDNFGAVNAIYAEFFSDPCPARAAVEVARLPKDALIEIEAIACI